MERGGVTGGVRSPSPLPVFSAVHTEETQKKAVGRTGVPYNRYKCVQMPYATTAGGVPGDQWSIFKERWVARDPLAGPASQIPLS